MRDGMKAAYHGAMGRGGGEDKIMGDGMKADRSGARLGGGSCSAPRGCLDVSVISGQLFYTRTVMMSTMIAFMSCARRGGRA